jgi:hypothetical protein
LVSVRGCSATIGPICGGRWRRDLRRHVVVARRLRLDGRLAGGGLLLVGGRLGEEPVEAAGEVA